MEADLTANYSDWSVATLNPPPTPSLFCASQLEESIQERWLF